MIFKNSLQQNYSISIDFEVKRASKCFLNHQNPISIEHFLHLALLNYDVLFNPVNKSPRDLLNGNKIVKLLIYTIGPKSVVPTYTLTVDSHRHKRTFPNAASDQPNTQCASRYRFENADVREGCCLLRCDTRVESALRIRRPLYKMCSGSQPVAF